MKKLFSILLIAVCTFGLFSCTYSEDTHDIEIIIPAESTEAFVYSDEEISPKKDTLKISAGAGISSAEVILKTIEVKEKTAYEPVLLKQNNPVEIDAERNAWFKIGVGIQNPSDKNITVSLKVEDAKIRIK